MNNKNILWLGFALMVIVQLFVPAKMVFQKENVYKSGVEFEFRTAPIDPYDPFRGKYITLGFEDNVFEMERDSSWRVDQEVYLIVEKGNDGLAKIQHVAKSKPRNTQNYFQTTIDFISPRKDSQELTLYFPFDRYYIEEFKAPLAEERYRESLRDSKLKTTALVSIKNGKSRFKGCFSEW